MIGRDAGSAKLKDWRQLAQWLSGAQLGSIEAACARLGTQHQMEEGATIIVAGVGRFLAKEIASQCGWKYLDFADLLPHNDGMGKRMSDCAPAVAVAWLLPRG